MNDLEPSDNLPVTHRKPSFDFKDLPPSGRLTFQLLTWDNYLQLYQLFSGDENEFVDKRFKRLADLKQYVKYQMEYALYSQHRGGCDWLVLREGQYVGVLHLYDLSHETLADRNRTCTIGFATGTSFRRNGFTREAVNHLLAYLFSSFGMEQVLSYTRKENAAAIGFLESLHFENCDELYNWEEKQAKYRFYIMRKEHFGKQTTLQ